MTELSVLIPSRNEQFLRQTVEDVLTHATADTEVIVVLDGAPAVEPLVQHDRLTVVILPESVGQRAATNLAARLSDARYVMKLDAHCSLAQGFDTELIRAAKELGRDVTQIPQQYNLHCFDFVCSKCGNRTYQGPTLAKCAKCGEPSPKRELVWKRRESRLTTSWRFDSELHFQYFGEYKKRPEARADIHDVMTNLGACFFMDRERYWELGGFDEKHGPWGQYGVEIALKSWLSGGRHVVNKRTWFAHMFRTQGGDFSFPYPLSGSDVKVARKHSQSLWLNNAWPGQVRPLSWVVEKFWPVPGWSEDARRKVAKAGRAFEALHTERDENEKVESGVSGGILRRGRMRDGESRSAVARERSPDGQERSGTNTGDAASLGWLHYKDETEERQALRSLGLENSGDRGCNSTLRYVPIPEDQVCKSGRRAEGSSGTSEGKNREGTGSTEGSGVSNLDQLTPTKGIVYYTDNRGDELILNAARAQLARAAGSIPITAVALKPIPEWPATIVLPLERGYLTMARQILAGLEASTADVVFFCEHDVLYSPSHFEFTPPRVPKTDELGITTGYYYNENVWKVDAETGRALFYYVRQLSGLCAWRDVLLKHFRRRVELIEKNGFNRRMGFEPGTHRREERVDDLTSEAWMSSTPNIDVRHGSNLTPTRWRKEQFRNQRFTRGWTEADCVPGWGLTKGRFPEILRGLLSPNADVR